VTAQFIRCHKTHECGPAAHSDARVKMTDTTGEEGEVGRTGIGCLTDKIFMASDVSSLHEVQSN
jgi:hypothetical protein